METTKVARMLRCPAAREHQLPAGRHSSFHDDGTIRLKPVEFIEWAESNAPTDSRHRPSSIPFLRNAFLALVSRDLRYFNGAQLKSQPTAKWLFVEQVKGGAVRCNCGRYDAPMLVRSDFCESD